jgi:NYN domain
VFAPKSHFTLKDVYYFSAYATWLPDAYRRHRQYVKALGAVGVTPVMAQFKEKGRGCLSCGSRWIAHEEKETDVNIALHMLDDAYKDRFDRALLVSADSDLAPPIRMVLDRFPKKQIRVLTPIGRNHSWALVNAAGGLKSSKKLSRAHLDMSLLPKRIVDTKGNVIATRPNSYKPSA